MSIDRIGQRQVDLGPAGFFRAEPETPPGNQVVVKAGFLFAGAYRVYDRFTAGDQTTAGFASVSGAGFKRYDLVYVDATGAGQIAMGTEVAVAAPVFQGGPGFTGGPDLPDQAIPVAYILVTETGAVTVVATDITNIAGIFYISRDLDGYLVDKGLLGVAPTGASDVVTGLFAGEVPGGGASQRGVVTAPPSNYVVIVDQNGDELVHATVSSRIFGRITEAGGIWTLSYFYLNASGVETAVVAIETETEGGAPTNLRLLGVPKVFSRNDPTRPLFDSTVYLMSDQVVGDIPSATTTVLGKVLAARVAGDKAGAVSRVQGASGAFGMDFFGIHTINFSAAGAGQVTNPSPGVVNVTATGSPGPPGPSGGPGPAGPPGPPGPGFSSFFSSSTIHTTTLVGPAAGSLGFGVGFNWRMGSAGCNLNQTATGHVGWYITSVSGVGSSTLTVNYVETGGLAVGQTVGINYEAAG
jgi:hypothetical protein